jgi:hypothetical protein
VPFLSRTPLPRRQQGTTNNGTPALLWSLWKLTSLCMAEVQTWDVPLLSSTHLDSYLLGWPLQGFPHVLNVVREPLLGPPHSHTLYHPPTNKSGVSSAHILPRFVRLPVSDTESPRVRKIQDTFVIKSRVMGLVLIACLMLPCLVPLVLQSIRTITEAM